jgi:NAD(P)H-dependent FMN reductase
MKIAIIHGTKRQGNQSIKAARYIKCVGDSLGGDIETVLLEPKDYPKVRNDGSGVKEDTKYNRIVKEADAYIIVTPEYNHSFPGALKTLLDSALKEYIHKPVAIAGVSNGRWGGTRALEHLIPVLRELGMIVSFADLFFPQIDDLFDDEGHIKDKSYDKRVKNTYTELLWLAETLKWGRKNLPNKYH